MNLSELIYIIGFTSIAVIITLYYTRKETLVTVNQTYTTEKDVSIAKEWQVNEGFNRAIDQLGNEQMETRLGGIYALERISTESEKDYWPILEILTAYVRKNSSVDNQLLESSLIREPIFMDTQASESAKKQGIAVKNVTLDIQVILTILGRRKYSFESGETNNLNLSRTNLQHSDLLKADFSGANLSEANLLVLTFLRLSFIELTFIELTFLMLFLLRLTFLVLTFLRLTFLELTLYKLKI